MKPRLYKHLGFWWCRGLGWVSAGWTPKKSYENWCSAFFNRDPAKPHALAEWMDGQWMVPDKSDWQFSKPGGVIRMYPWRDVKATYDRAP